MLTYLRQYRGMFEKLCIRCGKPIHSQSLSDFCTECGQKKEYKYPLTGESEVEISNLLDKAASKEPSLKEGDEIWFKRNGDDNIFHLFIAEVKDNVFKTSDTESGVKYYRSTSRYSWWEFDNIRILEIERQSDE